VNFEGRQPQTQQRLKTQPQIGLTYAYRPIIYIIRLSQGRLYHKTVTL